MQQGERAMFRIDSEVIKKTRAILKEEKVFTLDRLVLMLKCSVRTAQTKLKQWQVYTSYNQNGKYYTMPEVPHFDVNGLWRYENKYFSKHGNLKRTVTYLIRTSEAGLSGDQIGKRVGLSPRSFLHHIRGSAGIQREKKNGVYIYFSDDQDRYNQQVQNRMAALIHTAKPLSDMDAVIILTALVKHHNITIEDIMALPEVKARTISYLSVRQFLERHDLLKKTPVTKP